MGKKYTLLLFFIMSLNVFGQSIYRLNGISFKKNQITILNPQNGGMDKPIFCQKDLNSDGKIDLVINDMYSGQINTFLYQNGEYIHVPKYENYFPISKITHPFYLKDLNRDGIEDIVEFSYSFGLYVHFGIKLSDTSFSFKDKKKVLIYSYGINNFFPLSYKNGLPPSIIDMDGDGDLDILYSSIGSPTQFNFVKNYSIELNLPKDSILYRVDNIRFGQFQVVIDTLKKPVGPISFYENAYPKIVQGKTSNSNIEPRHSETQMVWPIDVNNDGLIDVALSDENCKNASLGINVGTKDSAYIKNYDTFFPRYNTPIDKFQPIGYWMDITQDSKKDLLVTSSLGRDNAAVSLDLKVYNDDVHVVDLYKNMGQRTTDIISPKSDSFVKDNTPFLSPNLLDVGTGAFPLFYDYNLDGKMDLLISNYYKRDSLDFSNISLFKNVGKTDSPSYILTTNDYLGYKSKGRHEIRMTAGDLNGDGLQDIVLTSRFWKTTGLDTTIHEYYIKGNDSSEVGTTTKFSLPTSKRTDNYSRDNLAVPCLYDLNKDGKLDLLIGKQYSVFAYKNIGTLSQPQFELINDTFVQLKDIDDKSYTIETTAFGTRLLYEYACYFNPVVARDTLKNNSKLFLGYNGRSLGEYSFLTPKILTIDISNAQDFKTIKILKSNIWNAPVGQYFSFDIKDINKDSMAEICIGTYAGGIQMYTFRSTSDTIKPPPPISIIASENDKIKIQAFPNPFEHKINLKLIQNKKHTISVCNALGMEVGVFTTKLTDYEIDGSTWADGFYLIKIENDSFEKEVIKMIKKTQ
jgi:hypothetical protein